MVRRPPRSTRPDTPLPSTTRCRSLFSNQPDATASFRRTFETLRVLPCDLLLTSHPGPSGGDVKFARFQHQPEPNPFLDPEACRTYVDRYEEALNERLAKEAVTPQP